MSILFLHSSSDLYGASRVFLQTILFLKTQGIKPVVVLSEEGPLSRELSTEGIPVHFVRLGVLRRKYMTPIGLINRLYFLFRAVRELRLLVRTNKTDLIYNNATSIFSGLIVSRICRTRHLWHVHEIIISPKWFAGLIAGLLGYSDSVVVVSKATKGHWTKIRPNLKKKVNVAYNGLSQDYLSRIGVSNLESVKKDYPPDTIWVGMIARVHFWKGQGYFLDIANEITKYHKNVMFLMAGDAFPGYEYLYDEINQKIVDYDLTDKVIDVGLVEDSTNFYPLLDIMVLPSILPDPLPTTCLEAMAHGLPIVATNHGGAVEMVDSDNTGVLISHDNPVQAYDTMRKLIVDKDKRESYGQNGRRRLEEIFTIEQYNKRIWELIKSMTRL